MRIVGIMPTRNRVKTFRKYGEPFIKSLGIPYLVNIEEQEREKYGQVDNAIYSGNDVQLEGALSNLRDHTQPGDILFKIDDDVKGFTGDIKKNLPKVISMFEKHEKLGGIAFPYDSEFYYPENELFSHINQKFRTCYMIRAELFKPEIAGSTFEDICHFLYVRSKGYQTLMMSANRMKCSQPPGKGKGGWQDYDRSIMAEKSFQEMVNMYPQFNIKMKAKPERAWKIEPDFNQEPRLKRRKI